MYGYAVSARIDRASIRTVARGSRGRDPVTPASIIPADSGVTPEASPPRRTLGQLLEDVRIGWEQTTFYLFDPESWR